MVVTWRRVLWTKRRTSHTFSRRLSRVRRGGAWPASRCSGLAARCGYPSNASLLFPALGLSTWVLPLLFPTEIARWQSWLREALPEATGPES